MVSNTDCSDLPARWADCESYLYGVDLFNRAYLWEAHEYWEGVWIAAGKTTECGQFVQGLIQVAAGLLRLHLETPAGARSLIDKAWHRWQPLEIRLAASSADSYMGVAMASWKLAVERRLQGQGVPFPFLILRQEIPQCSDS